jgi:hypothetical protein
MSRSPGKAENRCKDVGTYIWFMAHVFVVVLRKAQAHFVHCSKQSCQNNFYIKGRNNASIGPIVTNSSHNNQPAI